MSARSGVIASGALLLLAVAACSRAPPMQGPVSQASTSEAGSETVVLAGGPADPLPPASSAPEPATPVSAAPAASSPPPSDPLEPVNRRIYAVDRALGHAIRQRPRLPPMTEPRTRAAAHAVSNALGNLDEPSIAANDLLQRKLVKAGRTVVRFLINSTVGVVGLIDVAERVGLKRHENSLDRTLASYGAPAGPYLYLPIAGPTTLRAAAAAAAEGYLYPAHWLHLAAGANTALKGAGYAKLASKVVQHADKGPEDRGADGYAHDRKAFYAARGAAEPRPPVTGGDRPTALASVSERGD